MYCLTALLEYIDLLSLSIIIEMYHNCLGNEEFLKVEPLPFLEHATIVRVCTQFSD